MKVWRKSRSKAPGEGDIVGITGFEDVFIGETITDNEEREALPFVHIDPPTITMKICVNDSPPGRSRRQVAHRPSDQGSSRPRKPAPTSPSASPRPKSPVTLKSRLVAKCRSPSWSNKCAAKALRFSSPALRLFSSAAKMVHCWNPWRLLYVDVPPDNLGDVLQSLAGRKAEITNMQHNPHNVLVEATHPNPRIDRF